MELGRWNENETGHNTKYDDNKENPSDSADGGKYQKKLFIK